MPITTIMEEVRSYPVERRVAVADAVLQTLNPIDPVAQTAWGRLAKERRSEILDGTVRPIPVSEVLREAHFRAIS